MRIDAASLAVDGMHYESASRDGRKNRVVLGPSGGVTGWYAQEEAHAVEAQAAVFDVVSAVWNLTGAQIVADQASRLSDVRLTLNVPPGDAPTTLNLESTSALLGGVTYEAGDLVVTGSVSVEGLVVNRGADEKLTIVAVGLVAHDVRLRTGSMKLSAAEVRVEKLSVISGASTTRIGAQRVELTGVAMASESLPIELNRLEAHNVSWQGGHLEVGDASLSEASLVYRWPPKREVEAEEPRQSAAVMPDIPALDALEGEIAIDVKVTAAIPILKDRAVHHPLRVPIQAGVISFGKLEHSLSAIEDAILDFEVENDELILELDVIPIVKFDNVTLVSWSLVDPIDRDLARDKRIRLRRLLQYRLPVSPRPKKEGEPVKKKSIRLVGLDFAPIAISLSIPKRTEIALADGKLSLGTADKPSIESIVVQGALSTAIESDPAAGHLEIALKGMHTALEKLSFGRALLSKATIDIGAIAPARVEFVGLSPTEASGTVRDVRIQNLVLQIR